MSANGRCERKLDCAAEIDEVARNRDVCFGAKAVMHKLMHDRFRSKADITIARDLIDLRGAV